VTLEGGGSTRLGQLLSLQLRSEDATGPGLPQVRIRFLISACASRLG
jgi:hypothetical protein